MNKNIVILILIILILLLGGLFFIKREPADEAPRKDPLPTEDEDMSILLYYYNPDLDEGPGGVKCSRDGLVAVERTIPRTITPLRASIDLLLKGELTAQEKADGLTTEFPLPGFSLETASIVDREAVLSFNDPQNSSSGGSCRAGILRFQIEATAKQFPTVDSASFLPEELFQP